jgi:hypothetical protein
MRRRCRCGLRRPRHGALDSLEFGVVVDREQRDLRATHDGVGGAVPSILKIAKASSLASPAGIITAARSLRSSGKRFGEGNSNKHALQCRELKSIHVWSGNSQRFLIVGALVTVISSPLALRQLAAGSDPRRSQRSDRAPQ